jgi:hypothetical protein
MRHTGIFAALAAGTLGLGGVLGASPPGDIVLHTADATVVAGTWQHVQDATAASGSRLWHPDAGVPKRERSANPADYFELRFHAEAGVPYRLWVRGQAQNNHWSNDSVYIQFSGSVDAHGSPRHRIGTTEAVTVIVEDCSGCPLRGWGWQDNEYGNLSLGAPIYFAATGPQTLRVQGREDGISIDQIVLSPSTYWTSRPGAVRDDATILPRSSGAPPDTSAAAVAFETTRPGRGDFERVVVGDLDGDGLPDVVGLADNGPIRIQTARNSGSRQFTLLDPVELWHTPESIRRMELADVTGDGRLDLVLLDHARRQLAVLVGDGAGGFNAAAQFTTFGELVTDFALADLTGDGMLDLVVVEPEQNAVVVHRAVGDGTFAFHSWIDGGPAPTKIAVGDLDGDGKVDVASLNAAAESVRVAYGDGTGRFNGQATVATQLSPVDLVIADMDRDGLGDLIVTHRPDFVVVTRSGPDRTFQWPVSRTTSVHWLARTVDNGLSVADINGDGRPDIVVQTMAGDAQVGFMHIAGVLYGEESPYGSLEEFQLPRGTPVAVADLDLDGRPDIVSPDWFEVLWNNPSEGNRPPVADAGGDRVVSYEAQGDLRLSARGSSDPDGHALQFGWWAPGGAVPLSQGPYLWPFETPHPPGTYEFNLRVTDTLGEIDRATVHVTITGDGDPSENRPPTAVAHASRSGPWPYEVQFRDENDPEWYLFSASSDPDGDPLSHEWTNAAGDVVSTDAFYAPQYATALLPGEHQFTLTVRDGRGGEAHDTITVTVLPFEEIVMVAGYKEFAVGTAWERVGVPASEGSAHGIVVRDRNAAAPKVTTPLANPASYAEFTFPADPTLEYKLWIRLKAASNHWANDSLWIQFTGATDAAGTPRFRTGTTDGIEVNLEECSGCGISGWGWRDEAWGARGIMGNLRLRFPEGGLQTLRLQTREDGVSVDQIVLSARKYVAVRPGAVRNDTTVLTMTAEWGH